VNFTLFGYPRTGKTSLFNLLTGAREPVHAFDQGRREPAVRTCPLPDVRLDRIAALYPEKTKVQAGVDIVDLAGISFGEVKSSTLLGVLRKADGLVHVVRAFDDPLLPPDKALDPAADMRAMRDELLLADLVSLEGRLERLDRDLKKAKDAEGEKERDLLARLKTPLEQGLDLRGLGLAPSEEKMIRSFAFLSLKPLLHAVNVAERDIPGIEEAAARFAGAACGAEVMAFCGKFEAEIAELEEPERRAFMAEFGLARPVRSRFLEAVPRLLGLITFFTVGKDEVRAWLIRSGTPAQAAAGAIHSDIERGFVRAEVIADTDLAAAGSLQAAKDKGGIRLEGKDYPVRDGDVIYFRFCP
jgi:GTP-binding protein YchF